MWNHILKLKKENHENNKDFMNDIVSHPIHINEWEIYKPKKEKWCLSHKINSNAFLLSHSPRPSNESLCATIGSPDLFDNSDRASIEDIQRLSEERQSYNSPNCEIRRIEITKSEDVTSMFPIETHT